MCRLLRLREPSGRCVCNPTNGPVCASDGVTYTNVCVLLCKTETNPHTKFVHWGACEDIRQIEAYDDDDEGYFLI